MLKPDFPHTLIHSISRACTCMQVNLRYHGSESPFEVGNTFFLPNLYYYSSQEKRVCNHCTHSSNFSFNVIFFHVLVVIAVYTSLGKMLLLLVMQLKLVSHLDSSDNILNSLLKLLLKRKRRRKNMMRTQSLSSKKLRRRRRLNALAQVQEREIA